MTRIVDGRCPVPEDQTGRREHELTGSDDRERDAHPLPAPGAGRVHTREDRGGDVRYRFGDADA